MSAWVGVRQGENDVTLEREDNLIENQASVWVIKINSLSEIVDREVHVIHIVITYTLALFFLTQITCNLQATVELRKKGNQKETQQDRRWTPINPRPP